MESIDTYSITKCKDLALEHSNQGLPIIAYHGTYHDFNEFMFGDIGFHFSKDKNIARTRLLDIEHDERAYSTDHPYGRVIEVELYMSRPYVMKSDLGCWLPHMIFKEATYRITNNPFMSRTSMYLKEQKQVSNSAYRMLKTIGYDVDSIVRINEILQSCDSSALCDIDSRYVVELKNRFIENGYDGIVYINDYECDEHSDPLCYIAFNSSQVKILNPDC